MGERKRIIIVDDHDIVREGLHLIIGSVPEYEVVGEAGDGLAALDLVNRIKPDLALMDLSMPRMDGLEATREIKARFYETKVLLLTMHADEEHMAEAFEAGAKGYILKTAPKNELLLAVKTVLNGKFFVSPSISAKMVDGFLSKSLSTKFRISWDRLTSRERQILKLIAEGHTNADIASILVISIKTVETHRTNLMRKLDIHNVQELTAYAIRKGLTS